MIEDYEIYITNKQSPLACYNRLRVYKEKKETLTPKVCLEFLEQTNNHKVSNEILGLITKELEENPSAYSRYTEVLLGFIVNRNCREDNLQKIADLEHRFSKPENSNLADYILAKVLADKLNIDKTEELKQIICYLSKEDIAEIRYQEKILKIRKKQKEILKTAKQAAEGKDIWYPSVTTDKGCAVASQIDLERFGSIHFAKETERINIYQPIPQASNLSELEKLYTFWSSKVDLADYVIDLPKCTEHIILWDGKSPKELDLSHLQKLKSFNGSKEDFSHTQVFFPYRKELEELMLFDIEIFPDEFDLTVFSSIKRFRTNCSFKEHHNCRLPHKVDCLELTEIKKENGVIDFSSINEVKHFFFEDVKLGENVEIRFPQQVEDITFDHSCKSIPKQLNLNVKGLKRVNIDSSLMRDCVEEMILPQGFDLSLSPEAKVKITYVTPKEKETAQKKTNFWERLFSKTR